MRYRVVVVEVELVTQGRLIVDIARLDPGGEWYRGETAPGLLELGESEVYKPLGGMVYDLFVEQFGSELLVKGKLRQRLQTLCVRCTVEFEWESVEEEFITSFEISPEDHFMDLTEEAREAIILTLPAHPVCDEECHGLCFACGADLNKMKCQCRPGGRDSRWAALEALDSLSQI